MRRLATPGSSLIAPTTGATPSMPIAAFGCSSGCTLVAFEACDLPDGTFFVYGGWSGVYNLVPFNRRPTMDAYMPPGYTVSDPGRRQPVLPGGCGVSPDLSGPRHRGRLCPLSGVPELRHPTNHAGGRQPAEPVPGKASCLATDHPGHDSDPELVQRSPSLGPSSPASSTTANDGIGSSVGKCGRRDLRLRPSGRSGNPSHGSHVRHL